MSFGDAVLLSTLQAPRVQPAVLWLALQPSKYFKTSPCHALEAKSLLAA
jgi:hypothetical protein